MRGLMKEVLKFIWFPTNVNLKPNQIYDGVKQELTHPRELFLMQCGSNNLQGLETYLLGSGQNSR